MTALVDELKTRARVRLNRARRAGLAGSRRLRDELHETARTLGFADWEHARRVLGALAAPGADMGGFWHAPRTTALLSQWCAAYGDATALLARDPAAYLLPYRRQFVVVQSEFVAELGVDPLHPAWTELGRDLVQGYGGPAWQALAWQRLHATRSAADLR